jgi:hypothetical protein
MFIGIPNWDHEGSASSHSRTLHGCLGTGVRCISSNLNISGTYNEHDSYHPEQKKTITVY